MGNSVFFFSLKKCLIALLHHILKGDRTQEFKLKSSKHCQEAICKTANSHLLSLESDCYLSLITVFTESCQEDTDVISGRKKYSKVGHKDHNQRALSPGQTLLSLKFCPEPVLLLKNGKEYQ